jgi:hypothetical protein
MKQWPATSGIRATKSRLFNLWIWSTRDAWNCLSDTDDESEPYSQSPRSHQQPQTRRVARISVQSGGIFSGADSLCPEPRGAPEVNLCLSSTSLGAIYRLLSSEFPEPRRKFSTLYRKASAKAPMRHLQVANSRIWGNNCHRASR